MSIATPLGEPPSAAYWENRVALSLQKMCHRSARLQERFFRGMDMPTLHFLLGFWRQWAHHGQVPDDGDWRVWMIMAGRGYGKTRAGAEWVSELARRDGGLRIALVGATATEVRKVMIEGESGLLAVAHGGEKPRWFKSRGEVHFPSGAVAHVYSAAAFEQLRGPQHDHAWCDELAKWSNADDCWNNLTMGLRGNASPRIFVTTTPRPVALIKQLVRRDDVVVKKGATFRNRNLPEAFTGLMQKLYAGTRLGRQEIDGDLLEDFEGALWTRDLIEKQRVASLSVRVEPSRDTVSSCPADGHLDQARCERKRERVVLPELKRVVIGVDPPVSAHGDACGIVAVGLGGDGKAYVLADHSVHGASPEGWARAVAAAVEVWRADRVVAEDNQGGNMVESTLRAADLAMPVKRVHASRGKSARAEPVAALYEAGRAFHIGAFPELEDQMCGLVVGGGYEGPGRSPDRADALVWAMTELMLGKVSSVPRASLL